ncbi:MAG: hypothetical protein K2V38_29055, partial [Gemmataceae bacterium]|nr:hypothetical protein [Gemmataceae bacterium]
APVLLLTVFAQRQIVAGLTAGAAHADWGGPKPPAPPQGQGAMPVIGGPNTLLGAGGPYNGVSPDPYGLNPRLRRMFRLGSSGPSPSSYYPQMGYTQSGPAYNPTGYPPGAYGPAQGTLAFPHHPYTRSPRDFFMLDLTGR